RHAVKRAAAEGQVAIGRRAAGRAGRAGEGDEVLVASAIGANSEDVAVAVPVYGCHAVEFAAAEDQAATGILAIGRTAEACEGDEVLVAGAVGADAQDIAVVA